MKISTRKVILPSALGLLALSGTAWAVDNDGCTDATLYGDYAFTVSGQLFIPNGPTILREGVAMTRFDGVGHLTQVDMVLSSPNAAPAIGMPPTDPATGFHDKEIGSYTVNVDCTGKFNIEFPSTINPSTGAVISGAKVQALFVLSNRGRDIYAVVTSITPPGAPGPVPALISSNGHHLH